MAISRNSVWIDEYTLWKDAAGKARKARSSSNLSVAAYGKGFYDEAYKEAEKALSLYFYHPDAHFVAGRVASLRGDYTQAIERYKWAFITEKKYINSPRYEAALHEALGFAYKEAGYPELSEAEFKEARSLQNF